jgi:hypothetical protein
MRTLLVVQRIISISKAKKEMDSARAAIQLLVIMIESLKGRIDSIFNEIVIFAITELSNTNNKSYKISLIELVYSINTDLCMFHLQFSIHD